MAYECIKVEEKNDGAVTEITICPAPANILSEKMMQEITEQLAEDRKNQHKKLIVFTGEGKHFSFGASVEEHKPEKVGDMLPSFHKFIGELLNCEIPTMAKVSGLCLGGSFELVLACTFVFADESAKFGVPEIQLAVFPPVASVLLPVKCSEALSSQIILTGGQFTAEELCKHGLVNKVAEKEKLDETVSEFFDKELLPKSASSIRMGHRACRMVITEQYEKFIGRLEKLYLDDLMSTKDAVEGINSFLEKRPPAWQDE
jgi:cyclohexa-1,5-dienecarbonyl-CoA hydratase